MNNPFLIIGYERSGTTLLRRLVSMHPGLDYDLVHENSKKLLRCKTKKDALNGLTYPTKQAGKLTGGMMSVRAGQKVPYVSFKFIRGVIRHFKALFGDVRIIHIVRDPIRAINSQVRTFKRKSLRCVEDYFNSVPKTMSHVDGYMIRFEQLMGSPIETLSRLYEWMGQEVDEHYITKAISTRDPWKHKSRIMCGLRYFDSVSNIKSGIVLSKACLKLIKTKSEEIW